VTAAIAHCRQQQLLAAAEIAEVGWNERRAVLGMADYFAEEFLLEQGLAADPDICRASPDCPEGGRQEMAKDEDRFRFDERRQTWICPKHGEVGDNTAWINCWNGCDDGWVDDYEDDPIMCDPGDVSMCLECRGKGGWTVCGECNLDNPDAEY
jgi:hypothetical protein